MANFRKGAFLKAGGQADIFQGRDEDDNTVAMKYLRVSSDPSEASDQRHRFTREVKCHVSLDHPGIMKLLGANVSDDHPWFVMPLAESSLRDELRASSDGLGASRVQAVFAPVLDAIAHAHAEGVIHRDLKPENILFIDGAPVVTDFGYGRRLGGTSSATMTHGGLGTEGYAAPEQFVEGHSADERSDVYSLGCVLYEMVTGRRWASGPRWGEFPPELVYTVMTATNADASRRFSSVADMAKQLELAWNGDSGSDDPGELALRLSGMVARGDSASARQLLRLLVENIADTQLYAQVLPYLSAEVVNAIAAADAVMFREVVLAFDDFASGTHPFTFTDRIAVFLMCCFRAADDFEIRQRILERLLELGYSHNRFFVRDRFVDAVVLVVRNPAYPPAIAAVLRNNDQAIPFVREELMRRVENRLVLAAVR